MRPGRSQCQDRFDASPNVGAFQRLRRLGIEACPAITSENLPHASSRRLAEPKPPARMALMSGDIFDAAAIDADIVQFAVAQLGKLLDRFAVTHPSVNLLGKGLEHGREFWSGHDCISLWSTHKKWWRERRNHVRSATFQTGRFASRG